MRRASISAAPARDASTRVRPARSSSPACSIRTRCLSYLTIELRRAFPRSIAPALGAHVYGCDICQEVCPYNQVPRRGPADAAWQPRAGLDLPRLVELWRRPDSELRKAVKGSAMTRAKLTGLRRNLAVAIGNSGDAEAIAALAEESEDRRRRPMTRWWASSTDAGPSLALHI